jgi:farnesyl diphosphate synthase
MVNNSKDWVRIHQDRINKILIEYFNSKKNNSTLHKACCYAVLNGGKRIRALLVYATGGIGNADIKVLDQLAIVFELVHAYSLIHDDLPAMDDDTLRRGKATCHIKFNEAQAILAGDALQANAFEILSSSKVNLSDQKKIFMINMLSRAIGKNGMVLGQSNDIESSNKKLKMSELENLQELKTGLLIQVACEMGYLSCEASDPKTKKLVKVMGLLIGNIYQITDDILDYESNTHVLGKTAGKDRDANKSTYVSIAGLNASKEINMAFFNKLMKCIKALPGEKNNIIKLINYIYLRSH